MMCKNINKNKRGFSLVELMVVVAIMGTLAAIAIPAYNEYRKSAKKAAYKSDLQALHKGWLAFGVELDSFCQRETTPEEASIGNVGMLSLMTSKLYGEAPGKENFIGFNDQPTCGLTKWDDMSKKYATGNRTSMIHTATNNIPLNINQKEAIGLAKTAANAGTVCTLDVDSYKMGVAGHISGANGIAYNIDDNGVVDEKTEGTLDATYVKATCT